MTMTARIYRPAKTAMQSGQGKSSRWLLAYDQELPRKVEPLMGWTSSSDMRQQIKLWFDSAEDAVAYAERNGIAYSVEQPNTADHRTLSYSDNFKYNRLGPWTH
jgi:hypothetical protein